MVVVMCLSMNKHVREQNRYGRDAERYNIIKGSRANDLLPNLPHGTIPICPINPTQTIEPKIKNNNE
jgi:hypothetical protein